MGGYNPPGVFPFTPLSRFCIGSLKSANSVGNINTAESLTEQYQTESNWLADEKGLRDLRQVVFRIMSSILIYLLSK